MAFTNQLIHETSPYLLQHAHNPVNWQPYGNEAFEEAVLQNKPLLISIGYSSCHWCHVMEHESFENELIAQIMNEYFVCVKVDREEHPDVDHVYMDAVQQIHGNGGWPLNCFALPDGRPFWGGTYFRPEQWKQLLVNVNNLFHNRYGEIEDQAAEIADGISRQNYLLLDDNGEPETESGLDAAFLAVYNAFDLEKGGLKGAPKFPMPVIVQFLLEYGIMQNNQDSIQLVSLSLEKMACGGIYDQAGGGFSRYSTDSDWKVPHFEKMLYDNAQLISVYSEAFRHTGNILFRDVVEQTIEFVDRELTSPEGVFFSALDADSEGEEGRFYTWTSGQFQDTLGHYADLAAEYYGLGGEGLWENGSNILLRQACDEMFAKKHFLSAEELTALTAFCRAGLLKARSARVRPGLDDKMLVSWNAMMISALADAYISLGNGEYLDRAVKAAGFVMQNLVRPDKGLFHTWKNGKSRINAYLDDYAFACYAFLKLYSLTADIKWLNEADILIEYVNSHFFDPHSGFFWYSEKDDKQVFARKIEIYDGVIPSGNSVIADVLYTLGEYLHNVDYLEKSKQMLSAMESRFTRYPTGYANWASQALRTSGKQYVVAVIGEDAVAFCGELIRKNIGNNKVYGSITESNLPYFQGRYVSGKTLIYVCSGTYCLAPVESVEDALTLLEK